MNPRFGLTEATILKINGVFAGYPQVKKTILYGSRAKGNFKNGSDIDLALIGDTDLTSDILCRIRIELDDLPIPYTVDLSLVRHISDHDLIDHIQRVGLTFYEKSSSADCA
jgi:predicted nucleotidyltransferase